MNETVAIRSQVLTNMPVYKKIITEIWKCPGCSAEYSEDCLPRSLNCGHCVCSKCAEDFVNHPISCFDCFAKQSCKMVSDFPVNYPFMSVVNSHRTRELLNEIEISLFDNDNLYSSLLYKETWKCGEHGNPITYLCCTCNTLICIDCLVVNHVPLPRNSCRTINVEIGIKRLDKEYVKKLDEMFQDIEDLRKTSELELIIHEFCLEHCTCDIRKHDPPVQETETLLDEVLKNSASLVQDGKDKLEKLKSSLHANTSPEEMTALIMETLAYSDELKQKIVKENELILPVTKLIQGHLRTVIKLLVEKKRNVYVLKQNVQGTRWAPLTIQQEHLLLHSLRDGTPPEDGFMIPYEYSRRLVPKEKTKVFFEVGTEEETSGFVYFDLINYAKYSEQLVLMCSGEKGVSHRGTCFFRYDEETFSLQGGDYQNNDGTGGKTIIQLLENDFKRPYAYYVMTGTIIANESSTRFSIRTRGMSERGLYRGIMGYVREGLDKLKILLKSKTVTQIIIKDCGLFIPMIVKTDEEGEEEED